MNADGCATCPRGTRCPGGSAEALECAPGTVAPNPGTEACVKCVAGKFQAKSGQLSCTVCPRGSYCEAGANAETRCSAGYYSDTVRADDPNPIHNPNPNPNPIPNPNPNPIPNPNPNPIPDPNPNPIPDPNPNPRPNPNPNPNKNPNRNPTPTPTPTPIPLPRSERSTSPLASHVRPGTRAPLALSMGHSHPASRGRFLTLSVRPAA